MHALFVASEMYPLVKTGGLADVAGALPPALARHGIAGRTLIPGYPAVMARIAEAHCVHERDNLLGAPVRLLAASCEGRDLLVLDAPAFFNRDGGPYTDTQGKDFQDNWRRFAALCRMGAEIAGGLLHDFKPRLVHAHDWQAGLTPAYLRYYGIGVPSIISIHNIAFQGQFSADIFGDLDLPPWAFAIDGIEYYGDVGFLKAGLQCASAITTVSPTYAREIRTAEFGMGLDGLIAARSNDLHGIVNGIDPEAWDPARDPHLEAGYSTRDLSGRGANRAAIERRFGLHADAAPLFCVVSRLTWQKGMDLLVEALDELMASGGKLAVLGTGDRSIEEVLLGAAARHSGRIGVRIGYDEGLAHLLQGGADAILIPSRFEPCGLTQLYGLRYGCVPVVARVGGLADTIIDANHAALAAGVATGIQFAPVDADGLLHAIRRAVALHRDPSQWRGLQAQGMASDVSWDRSAAEYAELYRSLVPSTED